MNWSPADIGQAFRSAGLASLQAQCYERFARYLELLLRWNAHLNLTAIREPEEIVARHFVECAFVAQQIAPGVHRLLDYGSGAGFPGIPVAICRPEITVTLAESQGKKAAFLREALRTLQLSGEVYADRVERMEQMDAGRRFDAVAMRAVDRMTEAIPAAARRAGWWIYLMTTREAAPQLQGLAPGFTWHEPILLPGSRAGVQDGGVLDGNTGRVLLAGERIP